MITVPAPSDLLGFYQTCFAVAVMALAGRVVLRGAGGPAVQIVAGWAAYCLILTLWGVFLPFSLHGPAKLFAMASLGGLFIKGKEDGRGDLAELGRMLGVAAPLLLVMAAIAPSQSDALAVMMPNSAYIFDHGHFPYFGGPHIFTDVPVAPYNTHLVALLGTVAGGGFTANGPSQFTILLHLVAGLLLARVVAGEARPGWGHAALGLALATLLNPGFVPRVSLSGYGEAPLAITLLFAGYLWLRVMEDLTAGRRSSFLLPLALSLVALINIKQQGIGLFAAGLGGMAAAAAIPPRLDWRSGLRAVVVAALPAVALYLVWRGYVLSAFPAGELKALPLSQWEWWRLPVILRDTGLVMVRKPVLFLAMAAVFALLIRPPAWLGMMARRALALTSVTVFLYNGFVLMTFVGHFKSEHSFHRYNTHLSLLVVLALVLVARDGLAARPGLMRRWGRLAGGAAVILMLAAPLAGWRQLRFDLDMPQPLLRHLARDLAQEIAPDIRIAFILPGDNGSVADALESLLRFQTPRRPRIDTEAFSTADAASFAQAAEHGYDLALLSCTDGVGMGLPDHAAALLTRTEGGWRALKVWPYPPPPARSGTWVGFVASEPFCLK